MSKHTWLTKPTERKAGILTRVFNDFRKIPGVTLRQAVIFAGRMCEEYIQAGHAKAFKVEKDLRNRFRDQGTGRRASEYVNKSVEDIQGRWKNRDNYFLSFRRHFWMILVQLDEFPEGFEEAGPYIAADFLEESGNVSGANFLRELAELCEIPA